MKTLPLLLLALVALALLNGCALIDQTVGEIHHPDGRIERTTRNKSFVGGNAKQVVESTKLSNGKTQSIGTSGAAQESQSPVKDMAEMLHELNQLKSP
jgi:hypothetical protein